MSSLLKYHQKMRQTIFGTSVNMIQLACIYQMFKMNHNDMYHKLMTENAKHKINTVITGYDFI